MYYTDVVPLSKCSRIWIICTVVIVSPINFFVREFHNLNFRLYILRILNGPFKMASQTEVVCISKTVVLCFFRQKLQLSPDNGDSRPRPSKSQTVYVQLTHWRLTQRSTTHSEMILPSWMFRLSSVYTLDSWRRTRAEMGTISSVLTWLSLTKRLFRIWICDHSQ